MQMHNWTSHDMNCLNVNTCVFSKFQEMAIYFESIKGLSIQVFTEKIDFYWINDGFSEKLVEWISPN